MEIVVKDNGILAINWVDKDKLRAVAEAAAVAGADDPIGTLNALIEGYHNEAGMLRKAQDSFYNTDLSKVDIEGLDTLQKRQAVISAVLGGLFEGDWHDD